MNLRLPVLAALLSASSPALAGKGGHRFALTFAPAQLAVPQVELTGDLRLSGRSSVAGILGVGVKDVVRVHHFGGQYRYTFTGDWGRGAFLGGEVVTGDGSWLHETSQGLTFGGFAGGRYTFSPALTLEAAVGGRLWWVDEQLHPGAIVNLGLGWSF
ncbi:hypothetical protein L6R53_09875 [Myxococcota bacterium]|nr:hypothetical protein [Myxococcota bacterium]